MRGIKDYAFLETIGQGAYSRVYKCLSIKDKKLYACKRFNRDQMNKRMYKNLSEEIKVLKVLTQSNSNSKSAFIQYVDTFKTKRHFYLMVEYCNGGDLAQLLNAGLILKEKHISFIYR